MRLYHYQRVEAQALYVRLERVEAQALELPAATSSAASCLVHVSLPPWLVGVCLSLVGARGYVGRVCRASMSGRYGMGRVKRTSLRSLV
jgi:hypothetical protein